MAKHATFDIERWLQEFAVIPEPRGTGSITSPIEVAMLEHQRRRLAQVCPLGERVPVDLFVFNQGEPADRAVTKVGGLPCRRRDLPWPSTEQWGPMSFLVQFSFADSHDIFHELPDEILQVFIVGPPILAPFGLYCEWLPLETDNLVTAADSFHGDWAPPVCYGDRFRTYDLTDEERLLPKLREITPKSLQESFGDECDNVLRDVLRPPGVRIGGVSYFPGRYPVTPIAAPLLASFGGIDPPYEVKYPWINHPETIELEDAIRSSFTFSVERPVEFFLSEGGSVEPYFPYF